MGRRAAAFAGVLVLVGCAVPPPADSGGSAGPGLLDLGVATRSVHWDDWSLDVAPPPPGFRPSGDAAWAIAGCRDGDPSCADPEGADGDVRVMLALVRTTASGHARADGSIDPLVDGPSYLLITSSDTWSPGGFIAGTTSRAAPTFGRVTSIDLVDARTGVETLSMSGTAPAPDVP